MFFDNKTILKNQKKYDKKYNDENENELQDQDVYKIEKKKEKDKTKDLLNKALDNETNESIMNLTNKKVKEMNLKIIKELHLSKDLTLNYINKLKGYRFVDELNDIKYGAFIRWIPLGNPEYLPLHAGGIICDIKITDNGVILLCKNFMNKYYQIKMDECLVFQKLTSQELILLAALDHLSR